MNFIIENEWILIDLLKKSKRLYFTSNFKTKENNKLILNLKNIYNNENYKVNFICFRRSNKFLTLIKDIFDSCNVNIVNLNNFQELNNFLIEISIYKRYEYKNLIDEVYIFDNLIYRFLIYLKNIKYNILLNDEILKNYNVNIFINNIKEYKKFIKKNIINEKLLKLNYKTKNKIDDNLFIYYENLSNFWIYIINILEKIWHYNTSKFIMIESEYCFENNYENKLIRKLFQNNKQKRNEVKIDTYRERIVSKWTVKNKIRSRVSIRRTKFKPALKIFNIKENRMNLKKYIEEIKINILISLKNLFQYNYILEENLTIENIENDLPQKNLLLENISNKNIIKISLDNYDLNEIYDKYLINVNKNIHFDLISYNFKRVIYDESINIINQFNLLFKNNFKYNNIYNEVIFKNKYIENIDEKLKEISNNLFEIYNIILNNLINYLSELHENYESIGLVIFYNYFLNNFELYNEGEKYNDCKNYSNKIINLGYFNLDISKDMIKFNSNFDKNFNKEYSMKYIFNIDFSIGFHELNFIKNLDKTTLNYIDDLKLILNESIEEIRIEFINFNTSIISSINSKFNDKIEFNESEKKFNKEFIKHTKISDIEYVDEFSFEKDIFEDKIEPKNEGFFGNNSVLDF